MAETSNQLEIILKVLAVLQGGTLISILVYGYKVVRFFSSIEFKTDLMWLDYQKRMEGGMHYHRRATDEADDMEPGTEVKVALIKNERGEVLR